MPGFAGEAVLRPDAEAHGRALRCVELSERIGGVTRCAFRQVFHGPACTVFIHKPLRYCSYQQYNRAGLAMCMPFLAQEAVIASCLGSLALLAIFPSRKLPDYRLGEVLR
jgi:hypothetical protein